MPFQPKNASDACIGKSRALLALCAHQLPDAALKDDLRRSALVMAVTAIDSYMHWLVYRRLSDVRIEGDLPKAFAKLDVPFTELASLADATLRGRRQGTNTRPWVQVKHVMQKRLLKETFQSYEQVATAFALAGVEKGWSRVAAKLTISTDNLKTQLNALVHRRNKVVHEGDITRASRPQRLTYNAIDHGSIEADVNWVQSLIDAIEQVVSEGNLP